MTPKTLRGFGLTVPDGFVTVPVRDSGHQEIAEVATSIEHLFALPPGDVSSYEVAKGLTAMGSLAGASGLESAAVGFFRSPDDPERPVSVMITCALMAAPCEHSSVAIEGLLELFRADAWGAAQALDLTAGRAVVVVKQDAALAQVEGEQDVPILQRAATAWIPDPGGTVLGIVSVSSSSWRDWEHVCDLALDVLDSFEWEQTGEGH